MFVVGYLACGSGYYFIDGSVPCTLTVAILGVVPHDPLVRFDRVTVTNYFNNYGANYFRFQLRPEDVIESANNIKYQIEERMLYDAYSYLKSIGVEV